MTDRTRIISISHVQFTSGYSADLKALGSYCNDHGIDLVVDAAQSLGALPVYPEENHISAVVSSGWKWLMGPLGTGLMYTSETFRARLNDVMAGAELMRQGTDYLNHSWQPHVTAKRFEYSTSPISLAASLDTCLTELFLQYPAESIFQELIRLQDLFISRLDRERFTPLVFPPGHRSGILALVCRRDSPEKIQETMLERKVVFTQRGGYLRVAPHFYNTDAEIIQAVDILNGI